MALAPDRLARLMPVRQQIRTTQLRYGRHPELVRGSRTPFVRRAELRIPGLVLAESGDTLVDSRRASFQLFQAAADCSADLVYFDLADALPSRPDLAGTIREFVVGALRDIHYGPTLTAVRPHPLRSPFFEDDLVTLLGTVGDEVDLLVLTDIESADEVKEIQTIVRNLQRGAGWKNAVSLQVEIATPRAVLAASEIAAVEDVVSLVFEPDAYARTLGVNCDPHSWQADFAAVRQLLPTVAAAHGKDAVDGGTLVSVTSSDFVDAVTRETEAAVRHGFAAKRVRELTEVGLVQAIFTPSLDSAEAALGRALTYARTPASSFAGGREWMAAWSALRTVRLAHAAGVLEDAAFARAGVALPELERLVRAQSQSHS
ncbi:MAG: hypothetical protein IV100_21095 [Myxococcales bacterium]|nr:hypothetical protein [Myxococcales bacterium]